MRIGAGDAVAVRSPAGQRSRPRGRAQWRSRVESVEQDAAPAGERGVGRRHHTCLQDERQGRKASVRGGRGVDMRGRQGASGSSVCDRPVLAARHRIKVWRPWGVARPVLVSVVCAEDPRAGGRECVNSRSRTSCLTRVRRSHGGQEMNDRMPRRDQGSDCLG